MQLLWMLRFGRQGGGKEAASQRLHAAISNGVKARVLTTRSSSGFREFGMQRRRSTMVGAAVTISFHHLTILTAVKERMLDDGQWGKVHELAAQALEPSASDEVVAYHLLECGRCFESAQLYVRATYLAFARSPSGAEAEDLVRASLAALERVQAQAPDGDVIAGDVIALKMRMVAQLGKIMFFQQRLDSSSTEELEFSNLIQESFAATASINQIK